MPQIVYLDAYTANPGDLSWEAFHALGQFIVYDQTHVEAIIDRSKDAHILLTNKVPLGKEVFEALPQLSYVGVTATGYNNIDLVAAKAHGITVCNVPAYSTPSVVQHIIALMLELANHPYLYAQSVTAGEWARSDHFTYYKQPITELAGKTLGILGLGAIGQGVATVAAALGMKVIGWNHRPKSIPEVTLLPLEEVLRTADVISLNLAQTPDTYHIINASSLSWMKPTAWLINTARGGLIDEAALFQHLTSHPEMHAALDVLAEEPPAADQPLISLPNCLITPHLAWASQASRARLLQVAADNIAAFLEGIPQHVVSL